MLVCNTDAKARANVAPQSASREASLAQACKAASANERNATEGFPRDAGIRPSAARILRDRGREQVPRRARSRPSTRRRRPSFQPSCGAVRCDLTRKLHGIAERMTAVPTGHRCQSGGRSVERRDRPNRCVPACPRRSSRTPVHRSVVGQAWPPARRHGGTQITVRRSRPALRSPWHRASRRARRDRWGERRTASRPRMHPR